MTNRQVIRLDAAHVADFWRLHSDENQAGWCFCTAWWVPTWEGWSERSTEDNRHLRANLLQRGEYDGYLLYIDGAVAGWCQVGQRDRLRKLTRQFDLAPDPDMWAITCFLIAPSHRGQGHAAWLLDQVLNDLRARGAKAVEAFPRRGNQLDTLDLWNGPEMMFRQRGFAVFKEDPIRPVLRLSLRPES